jgi:hypothetical protein
MSEALLLLLLIVLSMNFVLGLWFAFKWTPPIVADPRPKKVLEEPKEPTSVSTRDVALGVWAPGWVARAGPPVRMENSPEAFGLQTDVEAYVPDEGFAPLF